MERSIEFRLLGFYTLWSNCVHWQHSITRDLQAIFCRPVIFDQDPQIRLETRIFSTAQELIKEKMYNSVQTATADGLAHIQTLITNAK